MTPVRIKRNSKAPNRFGSGNPQIETLIDGGGSGGLYGLESTSKVTSANSSMKLKLGVREPLKVKLPKLKRHLINDEHSPKKSIDTVRIHKIKLPSLLSKKSKNIDREKESKGKTKKTTSKEQTLDAQPKSGPHQNSFKRPPSTNANAIADHTTANQNISANDFSSISTATTKTKLDVSTTSTEEKSSSADSSFASDETDGLSSSSSSRMEIVVSQPDTSNGSGIRCPCGVNDDLGVMVECESCSTWQHGHCINVGSEEEAYEGYICAFCSLPQDKVRESLRELTVGDKFQSRFKLLESLRKESTAHPQHDTPRAEQQIACNIDTAENNAQLTVKELSQACSDLQRVMNSLKVKWRILTSSSYEMELRIWQNPYWSDDVTAATIDKNNFYFIDCCKSNLKLNIRNIVTKLEERCRLINYAIAQARLNIGKSSEGTTEQDFERVRQKLDIITSGVRDFKDKLKTLTE